MDFDDAQTALRENIARAAPGTSWTHLKTGGTYRIVTHVMIEATLEPAVIYRRPDAPETETWCRPAAEFFDGRFAKAD